MGAPLTGKPGALQWLLQPFARAIAFVKPPLTRLVDHDATSEPVDGKSDNIRPPDHSVAPVGARDGGV